MMFVRTRFVSLVLLPALVLLTAVPTAVAQEKAADRGGPVVVRDLDESRLVVLDPISIVPPPPRMKPAPVRVGDLIQIQLSYPIAPPLPKTACVSVTSRALSAEDVASTGGRVVVLSPKAQTGKIGVGFFSAYIRAHTAGEASAKVTVTMSDGEKRDIWFAFKISDRPGAEKEEREEPTSRPASDTTNVFVLPYTLIPGDKLADGPSGKPIEIDQETLLLWIDLNPEAKFAHETQHVLITVKDTRIIKGGWWPVLNGKILFRDPNQAVAITPTELQRAGQDDDVRPGQAKVWIYPYELNPRDKLTDGRRLIPLKAQTMLVWVDLMPNAFFAHPTLYVLIGADGTRVEKGEWWPVLNGQRLFRNNQVGVNSPTVLRQP